MSLRKSKVKLTWNNTFAYIIGIITTDGNLSNDLRHLIITSKDYEMVTNCKRYLELTNKISRTARGGSKDKKYYMLQFGDKNFFEFLLGLGLTPRKSKTMSELKIPKKYFADFFRGCIDGDGSISISKHPESKHPQYKVRLCSASNNFLNWILESCKKVFSVNGGSISKTDRSSVYTLTFGKNDSIKILKMIYSKNVICLSRKKKIALKILGEWRNW
ncbi:MAG: Intein-containing protein [Candidatus Nomurabacteria bacterium GW2011_GWB1_43_7]|uniref:Intein-containing protein n=1 Tax=Candidatus Nomurabacteria bacterium GW2011_GWB1_43_7 TaxID=1618747 RepID=A0A0G1F874_9BACT|nr:MAG: Intein-containing protein [Candidatus Nomurabacteria bacterium GW2011_GWB1_43_7]